MKKKESKALRDKLIVAVKKILKANNTLLTNSIDKIINKSLKRIVKKSSLLKKKPLLDKK
jgi:hypothetical protein